MSEPVSPIPAPESASAGRGRRPSPTPAPAPAAGEVVLATTSALQVFEIPGEDGGDAVTVTHDGVAMSKADAERVTAAAASCGVELITKEG